MPPASPPDVIVIGAGIGGMSAAIRLAAAGKRVIVLEQNASVGGKMGEVRAEGFRWDTGPSVITMRPVFEDLFAAAGRRLGDYLQLEPVDPLTRYFWPDGTRLDATRDLARMAAQIETLDPRDVEGYLGFLAYAARLHRVTGPAFIYGDPVSWRTLTQVPVSDWPAVDGWRTMDQAIRGFVRSEKMRQLLGRFATYVGASPYLAPATLSVIAHVELTGGVWYPRGGIYTIAAQLERLARELGVDIRTNTPVRQIRLDARRRVRAVLTDQGELPAPAVLANVDVATVYEKLLPAVNPARTQALGRAEPSVSGIVLLLGVRGQHLHLAQHNIFFNSACASEFDAIFKHGRPSEDPTIYVTISSKVDADHAPAGCENWFVLVNAPALGGRWDWAVEADRYRDLILGRLAAHGVDIRDRIVVERRLTPDDIERLTGARRGALYGASSNTMFAAFQRPSNAAGDIPGLYFAGGSAHPGGGVPMVMLSGAAAARRIMGKGL